MKLLLKFYLYLRGGAYSESKKEKYLESDYFIIAVYVYSFDKRMWRWGAKHRSPIGYPNNSSC